MQSLRNRERRECDPFAGGLLPGRQLPPSPSLPSFSPASLARPLTAVKREEGAARRAAHSAAASDRPTDALGLLLHFPGVDLFLGCRHSFGTSHANEIVFFHPKFDDALQFCSLALRSFHTEGVMGSSLVAPKNHIPLLFRSVSE